MQTEAQIRRKLQRVKYYYLKKRYERDMSRRPWNCRFNYVHRVKNNRLAEEICDPYRHAPYPESPLADTKQLPALVAENCGEVRLCGYGSEDAENWEGILCEDANTAKKCPMFELKRSKEQIEEAFEEALADAEVCARDYKDIAALQWVLDAKGLPIQLSWWQRFKQKFATTDLPGRMASPTSDGDQLFLEQILTLDDED
jgi:hypothetical protein